MRIAILALSLLSPSLPAAAADTATCNDLVVIARLDERASMPAPSPPADGAPPADSADRLVFVIEGLLMQSHKLEPIVVHVDRNAGFDPAITHFLLVLKRRNDGEFDLLRAATRIARGEQEFVIPFAAPAHETELLPAGLVPADYERKLIRGTYKLDDAWWLKMPHLDTTSDGAIDASAYPWGYVEGDHVVATKLLRAAEITPALSKTRCL